MKIKTYTENDEFPANCWFADWQPSKNKEVGKFGKSGEFVIRKRDDASTVALFVIPVTNLGATKEQAEKFAKTLPI